MKMFLISDNIDTSVGMRLTGIESVVAHTSEEVMAALKTALADEELGILLFTEKAAMLIHDYLNELKLTLHTPLIVEIPDRHGSRDIAGSINSLVHESIGLKL